MFLSLLSKVLASLLVAAITTAVFASLMAQTLLNSKYVESQLTATNSYSRLSDALVSELSKNIGQQDPTTTEKLKAVMNSSELQQRLNLAIEQLQAFYQGEGAAPQIDVSDLVAKAQAVGVPIQDQNLSQPISLGSNTSQIKGAGVKFDNTKRYAIIASVILALLLALVCWQRKRWVAFAGVFISVGISLGILAIILRFGPSVFDHYFKFNTASAAFVSIGHDVAEAIMRDLGKKLGIYAAAFLVVGIVLRLIFHRYHHRIQQPAFLKQR